MTISGTFLNDLITSLFASPGVANWYLGLAGNDTIIGGDGNDSISAGAGNDFIDGGFGFDTIDGGSGVDTVSYSFYKGPISANLATGSVGFPGNSSLIDVLIGIENIIGTAANDTIVGNNADNLLVGGAGNDFIDGGYGFDTIDGGSGVDTTSYSFFSGPINANLLVGSVRFPGNSTLTDQLISIENVIGSPGNDTIIGNNDDNLLVGAAGNDFIDGGFGFDTIDGGSGVDTTSYAFYAGPISVNLATGIVGFPGNTTLTDRLSGIENLIGTAGNDTIFGHLDNNYLSGNSGNDYLCGEAGVDTLTGGVGSDIFVLNARGPSNADLITDFSTTVDKIGLSNSLDNGLFGAIPQGIIQLSFSGGNIPGSVLSTGSFYKGLGFNGNGSQLSGIFADTATGNIFYNPTSFIVGDSQLIANIGSAATATLSSNSFIYAA
jgi:Ca2+-binding RTX toxin-like protein